MKRQHRLSRSADIARVRGSTQTCANAYAVLRVATAGTSVSRLAIAVPSSFGSAPERNRARRRIRAAFAPHLERMNPPMDMVAVLRRRVRTADYPAITAAVTDLVARCQRQQPMVVA